MVSPLFVSVLFITTRRASRQPLMINFGKLAWSFPGASAFMSEQCCISLGEDGERCFKKQLQLSTDQIASRFTHYPLCIIKVLGFELINPSIILPMSFSRRIQKGFIFFRPRCSSAEANETHSMTNELRTTGEEPNLLHAGPSIAAFRRTRARVPTIPCTQLFLRSG